MKTTALQIISFSALVLLFGFLFGVGLVEAQGGPGPGGFVTCDGRDCDQCNLVEMGNTIIKWLFGIIFLIFAGLMAVAGLGLVTSGGNQSALEAAKSKFTNGIIGILIVMSAWLIVDTLIRGLVGGGATGQAIGEIKNWGPWSQVKCSEMTSTQPFVDFNTGQGGGTPGTGTGPGQVPGSTVPGACSVPALSPITDPLAIQMERGQTVIFNSPTLQQCVSKFVAAVGGGAEVSSAFRPQSYQTHLWEIRDRWCEKNLKANTDASCSALKTAIGAEVSKHFGPNWACGAVAQFNSNHAKNTAVDVRGIPNHAAPNVQQAAAANCLTWRNFSNDPWHYELKPNCTCN